MSEAVIDFETERDGLELFQGGSRRIEKLDPSLIRLKAPAVILTDPKYPHNVGQALRLCSCYGIQTLVITGNRVPIAPSAGYRLPREERMRNYKEVNLYAYDKPFDLFEGKPTFVAIEVRENSELLPHFEHPEDVVYVFGPEDGSLGRATLSNCHRFVIIPTEPGGTSRHCLNLATAVGTVLYDRAAKMC